MPAAFKDRRAVSFVTPKAAAVARKLKPPSTYSWISEAFAGRGLGGRPRPRLMRFPIAAR